MCKLLVGIKQNNNKIKEVERIVKSQLAGMFGQPHGIGALIVDRQNKVQVKRLLNDYKGVAEWILAKLKEAKIFSIHTRQATSGGINERNIHFFKDKGYYFAHNGMVRGYSSYSGGYLNSGIFGNWRKVNETDVNEIKIGEAWDEEDEVEVRAEDLKGMCDSYKFLRDIKRPLSKKNIGRHMDRKGFMGVGLFVSEVEKRAVLISTRDLAAHGNQKDYLIVYSFVPDIIYGSEKKFCGIQINAKQNGIEELEIPAGIYFTPFAEIK